MSNFVDAVNNGRLYPVNLLILDQANPAYFGAEPSAFRQAVSKIPMVVTLSSRGDDSSLLADWVLPQAGNFEEPVEVQNPPTLPYPVFAAAKPVIEPAFDVKPAGDIWLELAKAVGGTTAESLPFESAVDMIEQAAAGLFESGRGKLAEAGGEAPGLEFAKAQAEGLDFEDAQEFTKALFKNNFWYDPVFEYGDLEGAFNTPSGRFEYVSQTLQAAFFDYIAEKGQAGALAEMGLHQGGEQLFMPHFEPYVPEHENHRFPLLLVPAGQFKLVTSALGNAPYLTKSLEDITLMGDDLVVHLHPVTAPVPAPARRRFGLAQNPQGGFAGQGPPLSGGASGRGLRSHGAGAQRL